MKEDKLLRVVGHIEDKYIEEAAPKKRNGKKLVKWLSVAASFCIICALGVMVSRMNDNGTRDNEFKGTIEIGEKVEEYVPETGKLEDIEIVERKGFPYYVYNDNGKYKRVYEDVQASKNMSPEEVVKEWLELNQISGTTLVEVKREHTDAYDEEFSAEGIGSWIQHHVATDTYHIYFSGNEFEESLIIGLINTISEYNSIQEMAMAYVNVNVNDKEVDISKVKSDKGYTHIDVDIEEEPSTENPGDNEVKLPCDNPEYMVNVTFTIKDKDGNPMKNIAYHLEFVAGEEGHYQPGQGLTDSTGTFTRKVHPNAEYILYLQKKNAIVYADYQRYPKHEEIVYEEIAIRIRVDEAFTREFVWEEEEKTIEEKPESQMLLDVSDIFKGPYEDVFLQLISEYGAQIQIGYLENDGTKVWNDGHTGWYYLQLQKFEETEHGDSLTMNKSYRVLIEDGDITVDEDWDGEMIVLE